MTVGTAKICKPGTARITNDAVTLSVIYEVPVTSRLDGVLAVSQATGLPVEDSAWSYSGESDASIRHTYKVPRRNTEKQWLVECFYERKASDASDGGDSGGGSTADETLDPEKQIPYLVPGFVPYSETVEDAEFIEVYQKPHDVQPNKPSGWTVGERRPVSNSAGIPVIPAIERQRYHEAVRLVGWFPNWRPAFQSSVGKVNTEAFTITFIWPLDGTIIYQKSVAKYEAIVAAIMPREYVFKGKFWYEVTTELHFNADGWYTDILDEGYEELIRDGEDDGFDGTWAKADDFGSGVSPHRIIRTADGSTTPEKKWLDGDGKVAAYEFAGPSQVYPPDPNYLRYLSELKKDIQPLITLYGF